MCSSDLYSLIWLSTTATSSCGEKLLSASMTRWPVPRSEERRVGKSVDLGGRRIIKKKKEEKGGGGGGGGGEGRGGGEGGG